MPINSANAYAVQQPMPNISVNSRSRIQSPPLSLVPRSSKIPFDKINIVVLAPYLETEDNNINYYYDFTQSIEEYTKIGRAHV